MTAVVNPVTAQEIAEVPSASLEETDAAIARAMPRKPRGHDFAITAIPAIARHMSVTGG